MDLSSKCVDLDECVRENDDDTKVESGGSERGMFSATGSQIGFTGRCGKGKVHQYSKHENGNLECFCTKSPLIVNNSWTLRKGTQCLNTDGSYLCPCLNGYEPSTNNGICHDVDECIRGGHDCNANANCMNYDGGFRCVCKRGYRGDGRKCEDENECKENTAKCVQHAYCRNTEGSFECHCKDNWYGNGLGK